MVLEIIVLCIGAYAIFGDYFASKASLFHEQARTLEIENDRKDLYGSKDDEEGS